MTPEETGLRFERRKDFELVDVSQVALPMYVLTVECICCVHRPFPPIALFVLRAIKAGVDECAEISGYLGLELSLLRTVIREMSEEGYLRTGDDGTLSLSPKGERVVDDEHEYVPLEESHTVLFDGILRRPVWLGGERLGRPSDIDRTTTIEIRPYPGAPPEIEDLKLPDVRDVLKRRYGGAEEFGRDLLAISRLARRSRVFRPAVGLAYRARRGPEVQISFVVDGVPSVELEQVFAEKGGPKKMGFIKSLSRAKVERGLKLHLGADVKMPPPADPGYQAMRDAFAAARLGFDIALRRAEFSESAQAKNQLIEAQRQYIECEQQLRVFQARPLAVYETAMLLQDALDSATDSIYISVTEHWRSRPGNGVLVAIERALRRGVRVQVVEYVKSLARAPGTNGPPSESIDALSARYANFKLLRSKPKSFFYLVKDRQFGAIANRPIMGPASRSRMFHQFAGCLLQSPDLVDAYISRIHMEDSDSGKRDQPEPPHRVV